MYLHISICILTLFHLTGHEVHADTAPETCADLKVYFEKELKRIENKYVAEIQSLRRDLYNERHERILEISELNAHHEDVLTEISEINLKVADTGRNQDKILTTDMVFKGENVGRLYEDVKRFYPKARIEMIDEPKDKTYLYKEMAGEREILKTTDAGINERKPHMNKKRQLNVASGSGVAFFAKLSTNFLQATHNQTIVFDHVVTNQGNGYHSSHGIFTCTTPGLYVFSVTLTTSSQYAHARLVKNTDEIAMLHMSGHWEQSSHTAVIELKIGDLVSVVSHDSTVNIDYTGGDYSSFAGFLLYDYSDVHPIIGK